jgi:LmbE family N-acetylglucosaminyl deacetylase
VVGLVLLGCGGTADHWEFPGELPPVSEDAPGGEEDAGTPPPSADAGTRPTDPPTPSTQCAPFSTQTRACGQCDSGDQTRSCSSTGQWEPFGSCVGERTGHPVHPSTGVTVCPPYDRPAVFFAPHPDDEVFGMGAALREHVLAGRHVFIELMTRGEGSGARSALSNGQTHPWHPGSHQYSLTTAQFGSARVAEFRDSATRLGVTGIFINGLPDGAVTSSAVSARASWWIDQRIEGLSLKGTAGNQDPSTVGGVPHRDHLAVYNGLNATGFGDLRFYGVYVFSTQLWSNFTKKTTTAFCDAKRSALDAYKTWDPASGRYAVAYHSTPVIWDSAYANCAEYLAP